MNFITKQLVEVCTRTCVNCSDFKKCPHLESDPYCQRLQDAMNEVIPFKIPEVKE